jgi:hypothetical protein
MSRHTRDVHSCTHRVIGGDPATPPPPPSPHIWTRMRGRYWSAKIDDISLCPPGYIPGGEGGGVGVEFGTPELISDLDVINWVLVKYVRDRVAIF